MTDEIAPPGAIEIGDDSDRATGEWLEQTSGVDRVISVALSLKQPRTAGWIADQVEMSTPAARQHLERLVDLRVLSAVEKGSGKTYFPDPAYQRFREIQKLIDEHSRGELEEMVVGAKECITEIEEEYDVDSPDELRKLAIAEETDAEEAKEYFKLATEWDGHRHMLSIAQQAIDRYGDEEQHPHDQHARGYQTAD